MSQRPVDLNTLGGRIWSILKHHQMRQRDLGAIFGKSSQAVSKWVHNESRPDTDTIERIAREFGVSLTWLITGTGPRERVQGTVRLVQDVHGMRSAAAENTLLLEGPRAPADTPAGVEISVDDAHRAIGVDWLPFLSRDKLTGEAVSGAPIYAAMRDAGLRGRGVDPGRCLIIAAPNDCGDVKRGDLVLIDRDVRTVADGLIYAVEMDGALMLRKVYRRLGGRLLLRADGEAGEIEAPSDAPGLNVLGEVTWRSGWLRPR